MLTVKITPNDKGNPPGKLADAKGLVNNNIYKYSSNGYPRPGARLYPDGNESAGA